MENNEKDLKDLLEELDVDGDCVYQLVFNNGLEILTEILPLKKSYKKVTAINPLRVIKDVYVDEGVMIGAEVLTVLDPEMDVPVIELDRSVLAFIYKVDENKVRRYVETLRNYYFNDESPKEEISTKSNIISFLDYKHKNISKDIL